LGGDLLLWFEGDDGFEWWFSFFGLVVSFVWSHGVVALNQLNGLIVGVCCRFWKLGVGFEKGGFGDLKKIIKF
jgi:hypothetical protein